jgi:carbamoylphosphate synthase large subunit
MKIFLIVPVFNEEEAIPLFYSAVRDYAVLEQYDVEIVLSTMEVVTERNPF